MAQGSVINYIRGAFFHKAENGHENHGYPWYTQASTVEGHLYKTEWNQIPWNGLWNPMHILISKHVIPIIVSLFLGDNRKDPGWVLVEIGRVYVDRDG